MLRMMRRCTIMIGGLGKARLHRVFCTAAIMRHGSIMHEPGGMRRMGYFSRFRLILGLTMRVAQKIDGCRFPLHRDSRHQYP